MRTCMLVLAALVAGCHWDLNDKGTDPESDQLYFPAGIAMDPGGRYVYVSNGNADLRFGGGTVMMIDMLSFECTVAEYRRHFPVDNNDPNTPFPAPCITGPHQPEFWDDVGNRALCRRDALDPSIVDCDESAFILQNSTVRVGNFAGTVKLIQDSDTHRKLFVSVRGDPSIAEIGVQFPDPNNTDPGTYVPAAFDSPGILQCVDNVPALATRSQYDPTTQLTTAPAPCDADHLVQDYICFGEPTCVIGTDANDKTQLPTEPFGMAIDPLGRRLLVSHLQTGQVSVINIDALPVNALLSESTPFFTPDATGRHGAFALAQQDPTQQNSLWYMTSDVQAEIATFRIGESNVVIPDVTFPLNGSFAQGASTRALAFDTGGQRLFATDANPPTTLVIDTRTNTTQGDQPHNTVTDIVDVCQTPSHFGVRRFVVPGAPGTPALLKTKIAVVCFLSSQIMIVDPDRPGVDDTIFSGLSGPNDIAFNFTDDGDPNPVTQIMPRHAYVTNYSESTLAVVDLEPGSPTENRVLARLGLPPDGTNP
jgi:hypothetical protein